MITRADSQTDSKPIAFNAVLSITKNERLSLNKFVSFLDSNIFSPLAILEGYPIYRLDDYQCNNICYLSNEKKYTEISNLSAIEFSLAESKLVFSGITQNSNLGRESYLISLEIINVALVNLGHTEFSPAELRLSAQIVAGLQLKDAANDDNVSLETKRSQLKSIMRKTNVGRQQDVLRVLLPELSRLVNPINWNRDEQQIFNRYAQEFLCNDIRCQRLSDEEGRNVRILDYGPLRGKPVLVLHPMIFPDITTDDVEFAFKHNLRLIWPLRPGILETTPSHKNVQQYADETLEGIDLAWKHLCGEPTPIIAMVSSAWHAVAYARLNPKKISEITFSATCFSAGKYENSMIYFGSSVAELCSRNVWLMTKTVDFIRNNVKDMDRFRSTIYRIFRNSPPDLEVLDREFGPPHYGARIVLALTESPESVKQDYFNQVHFRWSSLESLIAPVRFIHGTRDSIHKISDVRTMIESVGNYDLYCLKDAGHLMQYQHFDDLLSESLNLSQ